MHVSGIVQYVCSCKWICVQVVPENLGTDHLENTDKRLGVCV